MKNGNGGSWQMKRCRICRIGLYAEMKAVINRSEMGLSGNDFIFIIASAVGVLFVFILFLLQLFHHLAMPVAMHFWFVFIFAVSGISCRIGVIIHHYEHFAEGLDQKSQ